MSGANQFEMAGSGLAPKLGKRRNRPQMGVHMQGSGRRAHLKAALLAVIMGAGCATPGAGQNAASPLVGSWQGTKDQAGYTLTLDADGKGTLNGSAIQWVYSQGVLLLENTQVSSKYQASFTPTTLTLSGNSFQQPVVFQRVESGKGDARLFSTGGSDALPFPGNPPLTQEMVDKGARLMEWLLDARLTEEQHQQFQNSLVRSWKTRDQEGIAGTLSVLKFHDDLGQRSEAERNAMREMLQSKYLELMRQTPNDPLSQWVLAIYYSSHTPIANGNPPLTRQVVDAYAEVNSFMISEVIGGEAFKPDKDYKDKLANSLVAQYPSLSPDRQKELSQLPLAWAAIRLAWPKLSEAERTKYRQEWTPGVRAMLSPAGGTTDAATSNSPNPSASDPRSAMKKLQEQMRTHRMLFNMNQDYIHRYVLSPGWSYMKYSVW